MKNTYRFFVPPASISGTSVQIDDRETLHQWMSVLRLRPGQQVALLDGSGRGYRVELVTLDKRAASGRVLRFPRRVSAECLTRRRKRRCARQTARRQ